MKNWTKKKKYHHYNEKHNFCFNKSKNNQQNVNKKNSTKKCPFQLQKKNKTKIRKKNKFAIISSFNCETVLLCDVTNNEKDFFLVPCSAIKEKISQKVPQSTENKICSETQENMKLIRKMIVYITSSSCTNQNRCSISYITLN